MPDDDRHLIVTVHYYEPFKFTHQGTTWNGPEIEKLRDIKWTGTPSERRAIAGDFDKAITWAVAHRRPIYLGEFGAFHKADMESRIRWTRCVADEAMKRKISTAYWEFGSLFGAYDLEKNQWNEPLKKAMMGE